MLGRMIEEPADQDIDGVVEGRGVQHPLALRRGRVQQPAHGGQEAEVGHVVGFVHHAGLDIAQMAVALVDRSWCVRPMVVGGRPRWPGPGRRMMVAMKAPRAAARRHLPSSPFGAPAPAPPAETFALGDQVTHDTYGLGVILSMEDHAVLVDFRPQQRRIPLPCAKLTKL